MAKEFQFDNDNPALAFLSLQEEPSTQPLKEKRTRRVQLVLTQSVYDKANARRHTLDVSLNEYITRLIEGDSEQ